MSKREARAEFEEKVAVRLQAKIWSIVIMVATHLREKGWSVKDLASRCESVTVKDIETFLCGRLPRGAEGLELICRLEVAMNRDILLTPTDFEYHLLNDPERLNRLVIIAGLKSRQPFEPEISFQTADQFMPPGARLSGVSGSDTRRID